MLYVFSYRYYKFKCMAGRKQYCDRWPAAAALAVIARRLNYCRYNLQTSYCLPAAETGLGCGHRLLLKLLKLLSSVTVVVQSRLVIATRPLPLSPLHCIPPACLSASFQPLQLCSAAVNLGGGNKRLSQFSIVRLSVHPSIIVMKYCRMNGTLRNVGEAGSFC